MCNFLVNSTTHCAWQVPYLSDTYTVLHILSMYVHVDAVHSLTAAVMLLNQDLHGQNLGKKMTSAQFQKNVLLLREDKAPIAKPVVKEVCDLA